MNTILSIQSLTKTFHALKAVDNVSFDIYAGEVLGIIGPNGSGKTTLFNCITGIYKPEAGKIIFDGADITGAKIYQIAKLGIRRTFQTIRLFKDMSVAENIYSGYFTKSKQNVFNSLTHLGGYRKDEKTAWHEVERMAKFFKLEDTLTHKACDLPYGLQRRVEIARAMMSEPKVLILDEPAAGMIDSEKEDLSHMIQAISETGITVLMIEHDMNMLMELSQRVIVLNYGALIAAGLPEEIQNNQEVIEAYMGVDE